MEKLIKVNDIVDAIHTLSLSIGFSGDGHLGLDTAKEGYMVSIFYEEVEVDGEYYAEGELELKIEEYVEEEFDTYFVEVETKKYKSLRGLKNKLWKIFEEEK